MWVYILLLMMSIFSCGFVEGNIYFKIFNVFICIVLAYIYIMIRHACMDVNTIIHDLYFSNEEVDVDSDRFDRIKAHLSDVPEEDRYSLFDCLENGYIILDSEGYTIFKKYSKGDPEDESNQTS